MSITVMKQALEALEIAGDRDYPAPATTKDAITSLRQAIAEAEKQEIGKPLKQKRPQNCGTSFCSCIECVMDEQEPVSYTTGHCKEKAQPNGCQLHNLHCGYPACDRKAVVNPQPKQEPVAWCVLEPWLSGKFEAQDCFSDVALDANVGWVPLYTHPQPKREWVGLTDEEHTNIQKQADYNQFMSASEFAARCQALVEAKLKEKNT